ncbi:MAG TPA: polysaccharide biosynthesis/export family protein [Stellaceae bacterium]|jgi:polysaccharide export outer membrane protein|nr:polysaccharide biosynthesis/export family protein [Stellaceae bacterium]
MNRAVVAVLLLLAACSTIPGTGPLRHELTDQAGDGNARNFDLVTIDDHVIATLLAQPQPPFRERFKKYLPPPELPISIGDVISVQIWESTADGLYGRSLNAAQPSPDQIIAKLRAAGVPVPNGPMTPTLETRIFAELKKTQAGQLLLQSMQPTGRTGTRIPDQPVGPDGAISIPYGGRIRVAGLTPSEAQHEIIEALAGKAVDPQPLVVVKSSDANSVTVTGELVHGARVQLAPGGTRLLTVIAEAGGARAPVHDTFVELSRDGVTATIPLAMLVAEPDEDIFARPGDLVTLVRRPQVLSVFGATGTNTSVTFDADRVFLSEALAKGGGLADDRADPRAVYLLRYEKAAVAEALGAPPVPGGGLAPVAYRLDLSDARSYSLATRFPVRDKDIVYVANAAVTPIEKVLNTFSLVTQPVTNAYILCTSGEVKC